ncbi:MAG TPA: class I SAM-dependent methyltransferase [Chloroflexota bacterium]|nr:class I SAM-dependent methyltransferase [Chloroflexota bacterium]
MLAAAEAKAIRLGHPSYVWRSGQDRRLSLIRRHVELEGRRILDVGCGLGMYVEKLRRYSKDVYGVDVDPEKVSLAGTWLPNILESPAESLPFPDGSFDVILLNEVLEHVDDDRLSILEAYRCLRPGGQVVIYAPNRLYPFETHGFYLFGRYFFRLLPFVNWLPDPMRELFCPHVRIYTARKLKRLFDGLDVEYTATTHILPGLDNVAERYGPLGRAIHWARDLTEATPLRCFGISHFVVARKR